MGYGVYYRDGRWAGYQVLAVCDLPGCDVLIDRGLGYRCEDCELFFCSDHLAGPSSSRFTHADASPKPDSLGWLTWITRHESWAQWRETEPAAYSAALQRLREASPEDLEREGVPEVLAELAGGEQS